MKNDEICLDYLRDGFKDYLKYKSDKPIVDFELKMINTYSDDGFLKITNDNGELFYEVNGLVDFKTALKNSLKCGELVYKILLGIVDILIDIDNYMLRESGFIIRPDTVYMDEKTNSVRLLYVPGEEFNVKEDFIAFVEFIMKHMDHKDNKAVLLVYGVYHIVREKHYDLKDVKDSILECKNQTENDSHIKPTCDKEKGIKINNKLINPADKKVVLKDLRGVGTFKFLGKLGFLKDKHIRNQAAIVAVTFVVAIILYILGL